MCDREQEVGNWYALQVASRKERQVVSALGEKGYACFLPLYEIRRLWSDRIKITSAPLFPGYVFSRFNAQHRLPILVTPNVLLMVGNGKVPTPIAERELEAIRAALRTGYTMEPCDGLQEGDLVRVTAGPLAGVQGRFVRYRGGTRLILSVSQIQSSVSLEMDRVYVEPISKRAA